MVQFLLLACDSHTSESVNCPLMPQSDSLKEKLMTKVPDLFQSPGLVELHSKFLLPKYEMSFILEHGRKNVSVLEVLLQMFLSAMVMPL